MSEKSFPEVLQEEVNYLHGQGIAMQQVLCCVLAHISTLNPELAKAIRGAFSEAERNAREACLNNRLSGASKDDKAPKAMTHVLRTIEEMRAGALDGV